MTLEQQLVSLELAKKLKELGVKQESYFGWVYDPMSSLGYFVTSNSDKWEYEYSAYTVAELGEMLPARVQKFRLQCDKAPDEKWFVSYIAFLDDDNEEIVQFANTEANARAKMLIYLIENNHIKV